ncbi:hypothetical protein ACKUB1_01945 [Methanospirillum stamsii]|uniref:Uncharacterized protein n=1 Tax=Methanospirillum stamsii TaxID=1277351 RepID=A0A2V2N674_9EURY|nr:hypothetical protein [Methanospirillum stamsii]PWR70793.1 hypothetical protein DLD82_14980 [Methanospirillum stamsii]
MKIQRNIWENKGGFLLATIIGIICGRIVEAFFHESGHYMAAKIAGISFQTNQVHSFSFLPAFINYYPPGIPFFTESYSYIQYLPTMQEYSGIIAISGLLMNALASLLCFWFFFKSQIIRSKIIITAIFWILVFNLGALFSYIPLRVFNSSKDVGIFLTSYQIHPLILLLPCVILIGAGLIVFFTTILPIYCISIPVQSGIIRILLLLCSTTIFLLYMVEPVFTGFKIEDIINFHDAMNIFPIIVIGQIMFLSAVTMLGFFRICYLSSSHFIGNNQKTR